MELDTTNTVKALKFKRQSKGVEDLIYTLFIGATLQMLANVKTIGSKRHPCATQCINIGRTG